MNARKTIYTATGVILGTAALAFGGERGTELELKTNYGSVKGNVVTTSKGVKYTMKNAGDIDSLVYTTKNGNEVSWNFNGKDFAAPTKKISSQNHDLKVLRKDYKAKQTQVAGAGSGASEATGGIDTLMTADGKKYALVTPGNTSVVIFINSQGKPSTQYTLKDGKYTSANGTVSKKSDELVQLADAYKKAKQTPPPAATATGSDSLDQATQQAARDYAKEEVASRKKASAGVTKSKQRNIGTTLDKLVKYGKVDPQAASLAMEMHNLGFVSGTVLYNKEADQAQFAGVDKDGKRMKAISTTFGADDITAIEEANKQ